MMIIDHYLKLICIIFIFAENDNNGTEPNSQGCLNDQILVLNLAKIIDSCQPPTAFQSSYY